jgi:aspartyl-tRNA(Asn)/glutamyl-tRNA(Gln) amidotransferase subunit A
MTDWTGRSAAEMGRAIEAGALDPRALAEAFLDAIAQHPAAARIYARLTPERARAEAADAADRARRGLRRGLLDGVPVSIKDLFDTAGAGCEAGTRLLAGRVAAHDAACVARLAQAGMVCLGKTHMTELAFSGLGVNPMTATPPNRHGDGLAPGGSSSGAAASVAFGLAPVGLGSDTGGSVRVPAAWNDLVGLKTTAGRVPLDGVVPLSPTLDTVGPLCRTVEDAALVFAPLAAAPAPDLGGASLRGLRLMVAEGALMEGLVPEVAAAFEAALSRLSAAGARIERAAMPEAGEALAVAGGRGGLVASEAYALWSEAIEAQPGAMWAPILARFRSGRAVTADVMDGARLAFGRIAAAWRARTAGFDAVLAPATPNLPPPVDRLLADAAYFTEQNMAALRNTRVGNLLGLCALTLPTGTPSVGLMLHGHPGEEARLLRIGRAAEAALAA